MSIIKIAVVDDQRIFCEGIESLLNKEHGLKVIMLAYSGRDILKQLEKSDDLPDIILLDLDMPNLGGKETLPYLKNKYPQIKVVILSLHADLCIVKEMISLGASGYLCKGGDALGLIETIYKVNEFGYFLDPMVEKELRKIKVNKSILPLMNNHSVLNDNEKAVLKLICKQKTNKEIAVNLEISIKSVEYHRSNLIKKTNSINYAGLIYYAIDNMLDID